MYYRVAEDIKKKVEKIRPGDEKATAAVMARYTFPIKDQEFLSRTEQILRSHQLDIETPPMIFASNIELRIHLTELCESYPNLNCT